MVLFMMCSLKVFLPMLFWGWVVLIPINRTGNGLAALQAADPLFTYTAVDPISIANIPNKSNRSVFPFRSHSSKHCEL
jgi:hypothetical protein